MQKPATQLPKTRLHFKLSPRERYIYEAARGKRAGPLLALQKIHIELGRHMSRKTYRGTPGIISLGELADVLWSSKLAPLPEDEPVEVWVADTIKALARLPHTVKRTDSLAFTLFAEANADILAQAPRRQKDDRRGNAKRQARFAQTRRERQSVEDETKLTPYLTNPLAAQRASSYNAVLEPPALRPMLNRVELQSDLTPYSIDLRAPVQPPLKQVLRVSITHPRFTTAPMLDSEIISEEIQRELCQTIPALAALNWRELQALGMQQNSAIRAAAGLLDAHGSPLTHFKDGSPIRSMKAAFRAAEKRYRPRPDGSAAWGIAVSRAAI